MDEIRLNDKIIKSIDIDNPLGITTIYIGDDVEEISDGAFENFYNLHSIFISENSNLRRIGKSACKNCYDLTNLNLDSCEKLEEIDDEAFSNCSSIPFVRLTNSVRRIGKRAFSKTEIHNCRLSPSLEEIDEEAFSNCKSLSFIIIPSKTKVYDNAFDGTNTEVVQVSDDNKGNNISISDDVSMIENKENVIVIDQTGKMVFVPVRDKPFFISSHEFGMEYLAAKNFNTFIEDNAMNCILSNSLATIFMVDSYSDIFDILGFPNDLSNNQVRVIKEILETHKENKLYGIIEILNGHIKRSCDDDIIPAGEFLENFETIISNNCYINYIENIKNSHKSSKK